MSYMKTGVNTYGFNKLMHDDFEGTVLKLKQAKAEAIEIMVLLNETDGRTESELQDVIEKLELDGAMWTVSVAKQRIAKIRDSGINVYGAHLINSLDRDYDQICLLADSMIKFATQNNLSYYVISPLINRISNAKKVCEAFKYMVPILRKSGIELLLHNHETEFVKDGRSCVFDYLMSQVPQLNAELDVGWVKFAGLDVINVMKQYSDRIKIIHFKDVTEDANEQNRSNCFTAIGEGSIPLKEIIGYSRNLPLLPCQSVIDQDASNYDMISDTAISIKNIQAYNF